MRATRERREGMGTMRKRLISGIVIKSIALLVVGGILGVLAGVTVDQVYRNYLASRADTLAQAFDVEKVGSLKSLTETTANNYNEIRAKLTAIREVNSDVRFVYLMAKDKNSIYFLADSEPESSPDHSPNGEQYNDASRELDHMFENGKSLIEGPLPDDWGTWLSALAPIIDPATHQVVAVVGLDIPATEYTALIIAAVVAPLLVVSVIISFLVINSLIHRRRQESLQFRSELVSIASHELRTPLTGIRWAAEALGTGQLSDTQKVFTNSIRSSVMHLEESIDDILQLASIQNSTKMKVEQNDIHKLFEEVFATQTLPAQKKNVTLVFDGDWTRATVNCDALRMRRVFNNLISNAVKYSKPDSTVTVKYDGAGQQHQITIVDNGIGVPAKEQEKIFSGFYRASNAVKSEESGTGMGLYLSRAIIEQHGGTLQLESVENKGTTVSISLP